MSDEWSAIATVISRELQMHLDKRCADEAAEIAFREVLRQEYGAKPEHIAQEVYRHVDALMRERAIRSVLPFKRDDDPVSP